MKRTIPAAIRVGDYAICTDDTESRIYLVKERDDSDIVTALYLALNENADDILIYSKRINVNSLVPIDESFVNLNGYLAYVKSIIGKGAEVMIYEE